METSINSLLQNGLKSVEDNNINIHLRSETSGTDYIYTQKDMTNTSSPLAKILRKVYIKKGITDELFNANNARYCAKVGKEDLSTHKGNMKKYLKTPKLSINIFERLLNIIGFQIKDMKFVLVDQTTGEIMYVGVDDEANIVIPVHENAKQEGSISAKSVKEMSIDLTEDLLDEIEQIGEMYQEK